MATTETTVDKLFEHRLGTMQRLGFTAEEALTLCSAKKIIMQKTEHNIYETEVAITWHDVAKLQEAGATNDQILRILG